MERRFVEGWRSRLDRGVSEGLNWVRGRGDVSGYLDAPERAKGPARRLFVCHCSCSAWGHDPRFHQEESGPLSEILTRLGCASFWPGL